MKAKLVKIGNSRGVRIPKALLIESGIEDEVEMEIDENRLVLSAPAKPRAGWAEAFRKMAARGDDALPEGDAVSLTRWQEEEWEWK